ncbi:MAG: hypothetical protein HQK53_04000 [Oligoflexia bacterium]|nr:hypothetical protein [Oligoflexia bacterium]
MDLKMLKKNLSLVSLVTLTSLLRLSMLTIALTIAIPVTSSICAFATDTVGRNDTKLDLNHLSLNLSQEENVVLTEKNLNYQIDDANLLSLTRGNITVGSQLFSINEFKEHILAAILPIDDSDIQEILNSDVTLLVVKSAAIFENKSPAYFSLAHFTDPDVQKKVCKSELIKNESENEVVVSRSLLGDMFTVESRLTFQSFDTTTFASRPHLQNENFSKDFTYQKHVYDLSTQLNTGLGTPARIVVIKASEPLNFLGQRVSAGGIAVNYYFAINQNHTLRISYVINSIKNNFSTSFIPDSLKISETVSEIQGEITNLREF